MAATSGCDMASAALHRSAIGWLRVENITLREPSERAKIWKSNIAGRRNGKNPLPAVAADLVRRKVDVIVAAGPFRAMTKLSSTYLSSSSPAPTLYSVQQRKDVRCFTLLFTGILWEMVRN